MVQGDLTGGRRESLALGHQINYCLGAIHKGRLHQEGGRGQGGSPKADKEREVVLIYYCISSPNADKGGKGSISEILRTSFKYGPLFLFICCETCNQAAIQNPLTSRILLLDSPSMKAAGLSRVLAVTYQRRRCSSRSASAASLSGRAASRRVRRCSWAPACRMRLSWTRVSVSGTTAAGAKLS